MHTTWDLNVLYTHALSALYAMIIFYYKGDRQTSDCILRVFAATVAAAVTDDDVGFHFGLESSCWKKITKGVRSSFILFFL